MRESVMVFKSASLRDNWNRSVHKSAVLLMTDFLSGPVIKFLIQKENLIYIHVEKN